MDLTNEGLRETMNRYGPLLCAKCKKELEKKCVPIAAKMNAGHKPGMTDMVRMLSTICNDCTKKIVKEYQK